MIKSRGELTLYSKDKRQSEGISKAESNSNINDVLENCEQYRSQLIQYCLQYFDCEYEYAEDCVQSACVALVENLKNGVVIGNYKAWLYKVTLNYKDKAIKEKIKRNEYDFKSNEEKEEVLNNTVTYEPDYLENMVTDKMISERALRIISSLKSDEKKLYVDFYLEEKKLKEIANDFCISPSAVRKRHAALKRKIRKKIKEFEK